jgi:hypothetical protein
VNVKGANPHAFLPRLKPLLIMVGVFFLLLIFLTAYLYLTNPR